MVIPKEIDGKAVTEISAKAFVAQKQMTSIRVPDTVTVIGTEAFSQCTGLTYVELPEGLTTIESKLFYCCSSLTSVNIPTGVTMIGAEAFCFTNLTDVTLPEGVILIGKKAFCGCEFKEVKIPDSVTFIAEGAFSSCRNLTSVTLPQGMTAIGEDVFSDTQVKLSLPTPTPLPTQALSEPVSVEVSRGITYSYYPTPVPADFQMVCSHSVRESVNDPEQQIVGDHIEWGVKDVCKDCGLITRRFIARTDLCPTITPRPAQPEGSSAIKPDPGEIVEQEVYHVAKWVNAYYADGSYHTYALRTDSDGETFYTYVNGQRYLTYFPTGSEIVFCRMYYDAKGKLVDQEFILKYTKKDSSLIDSLTYYIYTYIDSATGETKSCFVNSDGTYNKYSEYGFNNIVANPSISWSNKTSLEKAACKQIKFSSNGETLFTIDMSNPEELYYFKADSIYPNLYDEIHLYEK